MERSRDTTSDILALSDEFYLPEAKVVYAKAIELGSREVCPYLDWGNIALHSETSPKRKNGLNLRARFKRTIRRYCWRTVASP